MKIGKGAAKLAAATLMSGGITIVGAHAAFADPAGCIGYAPNIVQNSDGTIGSVGTGKCVSNAPRTWRVEIKSELSFQPDYLVGANTDSGSKTYYHQGVRSCDGGTYGKYYGRDFFTSSSDQHDSPHVYIQAC